ncbi:hypothetical protein BD324DRAFT_344210 [Kockovaella imperatae]|uniref:Uncharacterized protein n=1 Tax=Kockovaella imperatae TaxID=4999 RepID=A0A1Y1UL13_9TREE|nr:hypothetical protein BD324DRAFT_344210 [Kockovaella imperatae]ORX38237.1 hypothetical protein BD324DRAFT_344210 [Kockovaella imperatae]
MNGRVVEELNKRFPRYSFYNLWPGLINTPTFTYDWAPFPFDWVMWLGMFIIGSTRDIFAPVPIYIGLCEPDERKRMLGDGQAWKYNMGPSKPGSWATNAINRYSPQYEHCFRLSHSSSYK